MMNDEDIIADFVEWIKTKDPNEEYDYIDTHNCCFAQYLKDRGICKNPSVGPSSWWDRDNPSAPNVEYPFVIDRWVHKSATFGEVLDKINKIYA